MQYKFSEIITLDERSVSLMRLVLGISILYNLIFIKLSYTTQIWGSSPLIPLDIMKYMNGSDSFSIFDYIRSDNFAYVWMVLSILSALCYTAGLYSKINSWILFFLFFNLIQPFQRYLGGYEKYTIILLFWSCFLPLDNYFSFKKPKKAYSPDKRIALLILIQLVLIYFSTGLAKYGDTWLNGDAVKIICSNTILSRGPAAFIASHAWIYKPLTYVTLLAEYLFPVLIFSPYRNSIFRLIAILFLLGFHASIFLVADVGNFSLTGIAAAVLLIPSKYWNLSALKFTGNSVIKIWPIWMNKLFTLLVCLSIYLIVSNNFLFISRYTVVSLYNISKPMTQLLEKINIKTPLNETVFFEEWKMFAPNPIKELGWLSIEYIDEDGLYYDAFSKNIINQQQHQKYFFPKGMERLLMVYGRLLHDGKKPFARIFIKYWYFNALKKMNVKPEDYNNYFLAQYSCNYYYDKNGELNISPLKKTYFLTTAIQGINTKIKK